MTKKELRTLYKEKRKQLSESAASKLQDLLMISFQQLPLPFLQYLHTYLPVDVQKEVDTYPFMEFIKFTNPGVTLVVPKTDFLQYTMVNYVYDDTTVLKTSKNNIMEPEGGIIIPPGLIDVVLVPLMAFDEKGNRVGYGKGFYDRFLAECRPNVIKIGLSFFEAESLITDTDEFDIPLTYCVTPQKVYEF